MCMCGGRGKGKKVKDGGLDAEKGGDKEQEKARMLLLISFPCLLHHHK